MGGKGRYGVYIFFLDFLVLFEGWLRVLNVSLIKVLGDFGVFWLLFFLLV